MLEMNTKKKRKILIAEDDEILLSILASSFEYADYQVITAPDGKAAFEAFLAEKPDCVLTDIVMPIENGVDLSKNILSSAQPVPIALMSGYSANKNLEPIKQSQYFIGFYSKPFDVDQLILQLNEYFNKHQ